MTLNKNYFLVILLSLFLFSFSDGDKKKNDLEKAGLIGKVKSVRMYNDLVIGDAKLERNMFFGDGIAYKSLITRYDINGNIIEKTDSNGKKVEIINYNNTGKPINATIINGHGVITDYQSIKYDSNGNAIEDSSYTIKHTYSTSVQVNGAMWSKDYFTDSVTKNTINKIDTDFYRTTRKFDDNNNHIESNYYKNNKFTSAWYHKYDKNGNKIESEFIDSSAFPDRITRKKYIYKYDSKRNVSESEEYQDSLLNKHEYKYDEFNHLTEDYYYSKAFTCRYVYKNDKLGNYLEVQYYDTDNKMKSDDNYSYEYDKNGNWIKKVSKDDYQITLRVIEYY